LREYAFLTRDEETRLVTLWQETGDRDAHQALVESQMAWAKRICMSFCRAKGWKDRDDAIAAGYLGILNGLRKFDLSHGTRLTTHTYHWILREVRVAYNKSKVIHTPLNSRFPEAAERASKVLSLLSPYRNGAGSDAYHPKTEDEDHTQRDLQDAVRKALAEMGESREADIIRMTYLKGMSLKKTGAALGLSPERVNQLRQRGVVTLKHILNDMGIR
jgi:RNA polymerase sigma factor (sigma-70 family)